MGGTEGSQEMGNMESPSWNIKYIYICIYIYIYIYI